MKTRINTSFCGARPANFSLAKLPAMIWRRSMRGTTKPKPSGGSPNWLRR